MSKLDQSIVDVIAVLDFHICEMTELIVRDFRTCYPLIKQQSFILQSLKDVRDTLNKEPKKD